MLRIYQSIKWIYRFFLSLIGIAVITGILYKVVAALLTDNIARLAALTFILYGLAMHFLGEAEYRKRKITNGQSSAATRRDSQN